MHFSVYFLMQVNYIYTVNRLHLKSLYSLGLEVAIYFYLIVTINVNVD